MNDALLAELERIPNGWVWGWVAETVKVSLTQTFNTISEAAKELHD